MWSCVLSLFQILIIIKTEKYQSIYGNLSITEHFLNNEKNLTVNNNNSKMFTTATPITISDDINYTKNKRTKEENFGNYSSYGGTRFNYNFPRGGSRRTSIKLSSEVSHYVSPSNDDYRKY